MTAVPSFWPSSPMFCEAIILSLPKVVGGTRHEYEHVPPQPYSNLSETISLLPLYMVKVGGLSILPPKRV